MAKITTFTLIDPLKVFVEYDTQYEVYVAQCLQTGNLVTADDPETTKSMIRELLEDEITMALQQGDLSNLLSNPAPMDLWLKFAMAAQIQGNVDEDTIQVTADIPQRLRLLIGQQSAEVKTGLRIATGKTQRAA